MSLSIPKVQALSDNPNITVGINPNLPSIPNPNVDLVSIRTVLLALKQAVESLGGTRGSSLDRAVTFNDLFRLGLTSQQAFLSPTGTIPPFTSSGNIGFPDLPPTVQSTPIVMSIGDKVPAGVRITNVPIIHTQLVPQNFAGSYGWCGVMAALHETFLVGYLRGGAYFSLGGVDFSPGSNLPTFQPVGQTLLQTGDIFVVDTPLVQDAALADVGVTFLLKRQ